MHPISWHTRLAGALLAASLWGSAPARAQSEASAALSLWPVASVLATAASTATLAGAALTLPLALSTAGAVLTVKAVHVSAQGSVFLLERLSDGAQASIALSGASAYGVGTLLTCSVLGTGVVLSAAGDVLAFIPNAIGQALLYNERL